MWQLAVILVVATGCRQLFDIENTRLADAPAEATTGTRTLVLHNPAFADLADFAVPVVLDKSRIDYAKVANPATDLRFDTTSGMQLAAEIERWDPSGQSVVWVRVPLVHAGPATDAITMSFGPNVGAATTGTWSGYTMVHHFGPNLKDSAGTFDGTAIGASAATGVLAGGVGFSGTGDQRVTFAGGATLFDGWSAFTLELWLRPDYTSINDLANTQPEIMNKGNALASGRLFASGSTALFEVDFHFQGGFDANVSGSVTLGAWNYLVYTFDGSTLALYQNGVLAQSQLEGMGLMLLPDSMPYFLGSATNPVRGTIDELRVRRQVASADWIRAQYAAVTGAFVTFD